MWKIWPTEGHRHVLCTLTEIEMEGFDLRIDTSVWGVHSGALFHKAWISCFLRL